MSTREGSLVSKVAKFTIKKSYLSFGLGFLLYLIYPLGALGINISGTLIYLSILGMSILFYAIGATINRKLLLFLFLFVSFYYVSYTYSFKTGYSNYKMAMVFAKIPVIILVPCFLRNYYKSFFKGVFVAGILFILFLVGDALAFIGSMSINNRLKIGSLNPIWISRVLFEVFLISFLILKYNWKINLLLLLALLPIVYVSGSKGPIVAVLITLGYKFYQDKSVIKKGAILLLSGLVMISAFYYGGRYVASYNNTYFVQRFLSAVPENASEVHQQKSRLVVWPETVNKYINQDASAILFGVGVGNFSKLYYGDYQDGRMYPHNLFLELLVEQGVLFLLMVLTLTIFLLRKKRNNFKYLFYYFLVNAMFTGDVILNEYLFFYLSWVVAVSKVDLPNWNLNKLGANITNY